MIGALLVLAAAAIPPAEAVTQAGVGLVARVEDEDQGDTALKAIRAEGCMVTLQGADRSLVLDLRDVAGIGLAEPASLAIARPGGIMSLAVDDGSADQITRLSALNRALADLYRKCRKR